MVVGLAGERVKGARGGLTYADVILLLLWDTGSAEALVLHRM